MASLSQQPQQTFSATGFRTATPHMFRHAPHLLRKPPHLSMLPPSCADTSCAVAQCYSSPSLYNEQRPHRQRSYSSHHAVWIKQYGTHQRAKQNPSQSTASHPVSPSMPRAILLRVKHPQRAHPLSTTPTNLQHHKLPQNRSAFIEPRHASVEEHSGSRYATCALCRY